MSQAMDVSARDIAAEVRAKAMRENARIQQILADGPNPDHLLGQSDVLVAAVNEAMSCAVSSALQEKEALTEAQRAAIARSPTPNFLQAIAVRDAKQILSKQLESKYAPAITQASSAHGRLSAVQEGPVRNAMQTLRTTPLVDTGQFGPLFQRLATATRAQAQVLAHSRKQWSDAVGREYCFSAVAQHRQAITIDRRRRSPIWMSG